MTQRRRFIILVLVALAVMGTFMLKDGNEATSVTEEQDLPVLLDLSMET